LSVAAMMMAYPIAAAAQSGNDEAILRQVIKANSEGTCPDTLMAPYLRGMCLQNMPAIGQQLSALGAIQRVDYLGSQSFPNFGPCEIYRVTFDKGSLIWTINLGSDGKIAVLSYN